MPAAVLAVLLVMFLSTTATSQDTLAICPDAFRDALAPWERLRQEQGHQILVIPPESTAKDTHAQIRRIGENASLRYLVLIGDVPNGKGSADIARPATIPTHYLPAKINVRWGSEPTIATDTPYADLDGDSCPDLALGRIPADSAEELSAVVRKIVAFEKGSVSNAPPRLHLIAGVGGFGAAADALVEAAGRQVFKQAVPAECELVHTSANPANRNFPPPGKFRPRVHRQLCEHGLAWIYMGHGLPTELDHVRTDAGTEPILSVADVPALRCGPCSPLAVLIACYTGALDSQPDCLAEELLLAEQGPIAVIAATRVTMPYGNTVFGYELLRACFRDQPSQLGQIIFLAQGRTLGDAADDSLRTSLDMLAKGLSPPPFDLAAERQEHVWMYHLFGDPLIRFPRRAERLASKPDTSRFNK